MPSMSTLMGKRWFGALRSARRLSRLRSRAHFLRFPPMRAPGCGDARALGKDALRCRVPAAVPARVSSAAVPSPDVPHSLPVLLDVSTVRAAVPLQLGDARVAQAHGGRLRSRTSSAEGVGAARAALQRARGERRARARYQDKASATWSSLFMTTTVTLTAGTRPTALLR